MKNGKTLKLLLRSISKEVGKAIKDILDKEIKEKLILQERLASMLLAKAVSSFGVTMHEVELKRKNKNLTEALLILTKLVVGDATTQEGLLGYYEHDRKDDDTCWSDCEKCYVDKNYDNLMAIPEWKAMYNLLCVEIKEVEKDAST